MAVPIQYRTTDYPPKYRPLGYWRHARRSAGPDGEDRPPDRTKRRFVILLAVLVATLVLHAGIAAAYLGDGSGTPSKENASKEVTDPGAQCDAEGEPDPDAEQESSPVDEAPVPGASDGSGTGEIDSSSAGGSDRGAL